MRERGKLCLFQRILCCDKIGILIEGLIKELGSLDEIVKRNKTDNLEDVFFKYLEVQDV